MGNEWRIVTVPMVTHVDEQVPTNKSTEEIWLEKIGSGNRRGSVIHSR